MIFIQCYFLECSAGSSYWIFSVKCGSYRNYFWTFCSVSVGIYSGNFMTSVSGNVAAVKI